MAKLEIDFNRELLNRHPNEYKGCETKLERRQLKKWKKIEEKPPEKHTNSLKTTDNSANSYSTERHQQKLGSSYNNDAMSLKNEDNGITLTPDPMKRLNDITDNHVLRKRKRKIYAEATQSDLLEGKIADISPNVGKVGAKSGKKSVDLEAIKKTLLSTEASKYSEVSNTPPDICVDISLFHNSSNFVSGTTESEPVMLSTQDMKV